MQNITFKMDKKNKVLMYSTGSYTEYPMTNHDGKEYRNVYMCITESLRCIVESGTTL